MATKSVTEKVQRPRESCVDKIQLDWIPLMVEWRGRSLTFFVDDEEVENLDMHSHRCMAAGVAVLRAIEIAKHHCGATFADEDLKDALGGASFLCGMAHQLRERLGASP